VTAGAQARPPRAATSFEARVYRVIAGIPAGFVATYAEVARALSCGSPRAVGQALKRNQQAPRIPCHRVIATDLTPGGYSGEREGAALRRKLALLAAEGVTFRDGRLADPSRLYRFTA
jgi:methylated-DNA-[protein]-cysteine S-methyltransferase